ncbi:unannotated protein [freshwater metagenome]|uniref:Unannotated protein n=1 Tax=freshwater metagenome TaxID=449393 RepID=A0A6J7DJ36_9ZZZZ
MWQRWVVQLVVAPTAEQAAITAAAWIMRRVSSAVRLRGTCRIAVSGGSTPVLMFDALAQMPVPWERVQLFQVDERVAPDGDPDRNATQLTDHLIRHVTIRPGSVHLMPVTAAALPSAAARYARVIGQAPLDIVHLGLGDDGHTASWPPGDPVIDALGAVAISGEYNARVRMTLTPGIVNAARSRLLLITGASKSTPLAAWLNGPPDTRAGLPVSRVRRVGTTVVADTAAASRLA